MGSFDTWTSLFLIVSSLGIFLSLLLVSSKNYKNTNLPIVFIVFGFSLILIQYVLIWTGYRAQYPYIYFFDAVWYLCFGPLLYIYICKLYQKPIKHIALHFIPAILLFIPSVYFVYTAKGLLNIAQTERTPLLKLFWSLKSPWFGVMSMFIYSLISKEYINSHSNLQSQTEQLKQTWLGYLISFFFLFLVAYVSYYILSLFPFFNPMWDYAISITMSIGIYGLGYFVFKEPAIFNGELFHKLFQTKTYERNSLNSTTNDEFFSLLINTLHKEKLYRDNNLRLIDLADKMGFSVHLLSKLINKNSGKNFNQFINEYRLIDAEQILKNQDGTSIKTVYFDVGFNNKTTFNNAFKKKHGCTPTEYKHQITTSSKL